MTEQTGSFCESDIRPDELLRGAFDAHEKDRQFLMSRRDQFVEVSCPACGGDEAEELFFKEEFRYVECKKCGTMFINPRPAPDLLHTFYCNSENYAYWCKHIFPASEATRRERIFRPRVERLLEICRRHKQDAQILLEVGAGFGTFCEEARDKGDFQRIVAVEPTPDLARHCRSRGLEVIEAPVEQIGQDACRPDVVTSFEVIEHLFSPHEFVRACASMLSPRGLLVLTCPSSSGFDIRLLGRASDTVDFEHLNYFTPDSLAHLLRRCGMEVLEWSTPGKLDAELVRKKVLSGEASLDGYGFLKQVLLEEWESTGEDFQRFLAQARMSSHLWMVARRGSNPGTPR